MPIIPPRPFISFSQRQEVGMRALFLVMTAVFLCFPPVDARGEIYKYVDKDGKIVFTDNPPPSSNADVVVKEEAPPIMAAPPKPARAPAATLPPKTKEQVEKEAKEAADKEVDRKMAEEQERKAIERQQRLMEADRLEKEARKSVVPTQENIDRQRKLMEEAERLRQMP